LLLASSGPNPHQEIHLKRSALIFASLVLAAATLAQQKADPPSGGGQVFGFRDFSQQKKWDQKFIDVPEAGRAEEHLRILTAAPHVAGSPEDKKTADYVAQKFKEAGLETEIVEYKVWMNRPAEVSVSVTAPPNVKMNGPSRERVSSDPFQDDPRILPAFNGSSPSGDVEAEVVYANYGRPADFKKLEELKVDVRGKIVLVRYGENFRGVKSFVAEEHGAAGVIIYSDPWDDGYFKGDAYPKGPWRPETAVQRGSIQYMFKYPGDPTTPGVASLPSLPDSKRVPPEQAPDMPKIPTTPLSYGDAAPILQNLTGPETPREWQGALPFTYHVGPGPVKVKIHLKQDYRYWPIWNVIGKIPGAKYPDQWVVLGNHRDAWAYGAVDPNSGTAAMLETVHGLGELLKLKWRPDRTIIFASWDAEEEGLIGSTEWGEEHEHELANAVGYFNLDVAVTGPNFGASAVPSLKGFVREVTKQVPSPKGGTVYDVWKERQRETSTRMSDRGRSPNAKVENDVPVGDLGSGSDYSVFIQHLGVPSADMTSSGSYGVYHSAFDNFAWFKKFGDPTFAYEKEMAQIFGVEALHLASADVLPYDYELYGKEIAAYIETAQTKAKQELGSNAPDFSRATAAAKRFTDAGTKVMAVQKNPPNGNDAARLNHTLIAAERALLLDKGLPNRPWFRHSIYAPGQYTGYAAVVIPGVNEAIDSKNAPATAEQIQALTDALNRAAGVLEGYREQPANGN
jgi:N-acetylated-alpha-linked acidic dipeptidase